MRTQAKTGATSDTTSLLTVVQVCTMLGIGRTKFYRLVDEGLPTVKLVKLRRIRRISLDRWLEQQEQVAG